MAERKRGNKSGLARRNWESAKERAFDAKDKTQTFVEENPWKSVGIAAAIGALTALGVVALLRRGRKSWWEGLRDMF